MGRHDAATSATWCSTPVGSQVLPVLLALPDVDVPAGTRPTFTDAQVLAAVEETLGEAARGLRGKVAVAARVALVRAALAQLPPRRPSPHRVGLGSPT